MILVGWRIDRQGAQPKCIACCLCVPCGAHPHSSQGSGRSAEVRVPGAFWRAQRPRAFWSRPKTLSAFAMHRLHITSTFKSMSHAACFVSKNFGFHFFVVFKEREPGPRMLRGLERSGEASNQVVPQTATSLEPCMYPAQVLLPRWSLLRLVALATPVRMGKNGWFPTKEA